MRKGPDQRNVEAMRNLKSLLQKIITTPEAYVGNSELKLALHSQGALAKFEAVDYGIVATSINTHKRIVGSAGFSSYSEFDFLRQKALSQLVQYSARPPENSARTKKGLENKIERLEAQLQSSKEDCMHLTNVLVSTLRQARGVIRSDGTDVMLKKWNKIERELYTMLTNVNDPVITDRDQGVTLS